MELKIQTFVISICYKGFRWELLKMGRRDHTSPWSSVNTGEESEVLQIQKVREICYSKNQSTLMDRICKTDLPV